MFVMTEDYSRYNTNILLNQLSIHYTN